MNPHHFIINLTQMNMGWSKSNEISNMTYLIDVSSLDYPLWRFYIVEYIRCLFWVSMHLLFVHYS